MTNKLLTYLLVYLLTAVAVVITEGPVDAAVSGFGATTTADFFRPVMTSRCMTSLRTEYMSETRDMRRVRAATASSSRARSRASSAYDSDHIGHSVTSRQFSY